MDLSVNDGWGLDFNFAAPPTRIHMTENEVSYAIRGAIFKVYNVLGPGLLESVYESALFYELEEAGLEVQRQIAIPVFYKGVKISGAGFFADILVEKKVMLEIKSVENLAASHYKQLVTYLRLANLKLGLLVNFSTTDVSKSIHRIVNNL